MRFPLYRLRDRHCAESNVSAASAVGGFRPESLVLPNRSRECLLVGSLRGAIFMFMRSPNLLPSLTLMSFLGTSPSSLVCRQLREFIEDADGNLAGLLFIHGLTSLDRSSPLSASHSSILLTQRPDCASTHSGSSSWASRTGRRTMPAHTSTLSYRFTLAPPATAAIPVHLFSQLLTHYPPMLTTIESPSMLVCYGQQIVRV